MGYSPWGHKELDVTEHTCMRAHTHTHTHTCTHTHTHMHTHTQDQGGTTGLDLAILCMCVIEIFFFFPPGRIQVGLRRELTVSSLYSGCFRDG